MPENTTTPDPAPNAEPEISTYRKMLRMLTPHEKRRGAVVLMMVLVMALVETAGVASVLPFLSVLGNPDVVQTNPLLSRLFDWSGTGDVQRFLLLLGSAAFLVILLSTFLRILTLYAINRYTGALRHGMSERLLETYLRQPYAFFLNRHSGDLAKGILSEVEQALGLVFIPVLHVIAYSVVALALVVLLVVVDPLIALGVGLGIGSLYLVIYLAVQRFLGRIGEERTASNRERFTAAGEALGGIKDIKLLGREYAYLSRFRPASQRFSLHQASVQTLAEAPKFLIEAVAVGGVLALALVLMATTGGIGTVLPILGLYAFAGYKMIPAAQRIYEGFARLRFGASAIEDLYKDLRDRERLAEIRTQPSSRWVPGQCIELRGVTFHYEGANAPALCNINLRIPVGQAFGIVGSTGAGKTTLVDLILGLLRPTEGAIHVDDIPVSEDNLRNWQNALGYVPQDIFLTDTSVAENIALGVAADRIDRSAVERAARMAQIHDFIVNDLPKGYDTLVGERGVRLSGGQRQRIGIARALYHDPPVLVFDEATSALDTVTEQAVIDAVHAVGGDKTIIIIAHRLSTVRPCATISLFQAGRLAAQGSYDELVADSEAFRALAPQQSLLGDRS